MSTISNVSVSATALRLRFSRACLESPGFTEFIGRARPVNNARSINRLAVWQQRNLQLQEISSLPESEFVPQHWPGVLRFPLGNIDWLVRNVSRRQIGGFANSFHFRGINF